MAKHVRILPTLALLGIGASLGGCATSPMSQYGGRQLSDRECMARVMYFESNRSSDDGMLAVGTVVMNRVQSPRYPKTVCGVVGQSNQFAEGALTKGVSKRSTSWTRAERAADAVLSGDRHPGVGSAMFFHTAGYSFPYRNMHYLTLAGGNVFYEKRRPGTFTPGMPWEREAPATMVAEAAPPRVRAEPARIAVAAVEPVRPRPLAIRPAPERAPAPVVLAAVRPVAKPTAQPSAKPIVVAMLSEPKGRPVRPRSIADLIDMDLRQQ